MFVIVTYCYICIPVGFSTFFYTHSSFVLSFFVFFYPRRSSSRFMNDEFFGAHHLLFDVIHLDTELSHLAHMVLRYLILHTQGFGIIYWEIWAFFSHRFIHLLPLANITVWVIRPPWGYEISCLLWSDSFGQAMSTDWVWNVRRSPLLQGSHIVFPFSLLALGPWSETDDTENWDRWGHLCSMFWHVHTRACPHPCMLALVFIHVRRHSISLSDIMGIRVWVSPTFNSVSSYNRMLLGTNPRSDSQYSLTQQGCAHWGIPHSLSCSLVQTIGSSVTYFKVFLEIFEFQMYTLGHTPYQFYG